MEIRLELIPAPWSSDLNRYLRTRQNSRDNGSMEVRSELARENKFGQTVPCMKDGGEKTRQMAKVDSYTLMVMSMMECGLMIRLMDTVFIAI